MAHISELVPGPGERHGLFGGTRAGKSAFQDWCLREVQRARPDAMQILVDTKPRFRAETEKGLRPGWRKNAAHRYSSWSAGPVVPNSVVVDLWSDKPFRGLFQTPGEIAILQSGEEADWKRMLQLLDGFVKANISGRERRMTVDECLDFTSGTRIPLIPRMTCFTVLRVPEGNGTLESTWERTRYRGFQDLFERCFPGSRSFTCVTMPQT
jgi:hypothetical protein